MLFAMFGRHSPAGNWLYALISTIAVFALASVAVYVLTNVWREHADGLEGEEATSAPAPEPTPSAPQSRSAAEILDCRLAAGEITVTEYEQLAEVLGRRHAAPGAAAAMNGAATAAV